VNKQPETFNLQPSTWNFNLKPGTSTMTTSDIIGRPTALQDGRIKVTGTIRYATDLELPGMLYARLVGTPYAHARLQTVDKSAAEAVPGVVAVLVAADMPAIAPSGRAQLLLARDRVIFTGQPVALVVAESEAAAAEGAAQVMATYEPLAAAVTLDQALAPDAPLVWPEGVPDESGEAGAHGAGGDGTDQKEEASNVSGRNRFQRGDVAAGFAAADLIVEQTLTTSAVHQNYLEPHATVVQPDPAGPGVTVWTSTQGPFYVRKTVASILEVAEAEVRVVATPVGGGFGGKFTLYEPLLALAARRLRRPVRLVLSRMEELQAGTPAPAARLHVKLGCRQDGTFTALAADLTFESGCYPSFHSIAALLLSSLYPVPNLDVHYREVLTFKPSVGAYRAPGAPQATFALESVVDEAARRLGMDPFELRLKNAAHKGELMGNGRAWPAIGMRETLAALRAHPAWQEREQARAAGRGVGVAIGGWPGGTEPAAAACALQRDGSLHIHVGSVDLTGTTTGFTLLAADAFGLDPERVRVISGDTANAPFAGAAGGSKITYTVGPAVIQAAQEARRQVLDIAAEEFEADPADLEIVAGKVQVRGVPDKAISLADIAAKTMQFGGKYAPVWGHGRHAVQAQAPGFCAQLAEVSVDGETGEVTVHRLVLAQDVGRAINPPAIEGQMTGGAVQGVGWALYEALRHSPDGQLLTGSWMEYPVARAAQAAATIETVLVEVPSEQGPLGARGVGEPPVIATAAAVANAIADATGARLVDLPITPSAVVQALAPAGQAEVASEQA
jgi:CO/xanthine dehydrogenase Mo-binding subunit